MFRYSFLLISLALLFYFGCGNRGNLNRVAKEIETERQLGEMIPPPFGRPLPYRLDRYEAIGLSDDMMLEQTTKNRAMQDALMKLSIATEANIIGSVKDFINSHPVFRQVGEIDTTLSFSEVFYENVSKTITKTTLKGAIVSHFYKDKHGVLGREDVMYCYAFAPKYPELMELQALQIGKEELEKFRTLQLRQGLAENARIRMNFLLKNLEEEIDQKEDRR